MKRKLKSGCSLYEIFSRAMMHLDTLRVPTLQRWDLDLDNYRVLEGVAVGLTRSQGDMVRFLGRDASFYSHAVDRMIAKGWLEKVGKSTRKARFTLKITPRGRKVYASILGGCEFHLNTALSRMHRSSRSALISQLSNLNNLMEGGADHHTGQPRAGMGVEGQMPLFASEGKKAPQPEVLTAAQDMALAASGSN